MEKQLRCSQCRKVIGILKQDLLEIKCEHCGKLNHIDPKTGRVVKVKKEKR